jgi:hypothetical protein
MPVPAVHLIPVPDVFLRSPVDQVPARLAGFLLAAGCPPVVERVTVQMTDLHSFGAWPDESPHDEHVGGEAPVLLAIGEAEAKVTVLIESA